MVLNATTLGQVYPLLIVITLTKLKWGFMSSKSQQKIATILSAYDDLIENNLRRIKILEEIAQNLYREWFVKFRFPGHEQARMVDSPVGKIPEGWEVKLVKNFGEVITGKTPSKKRFDYYGSDLPFVKTPDMHGTIFVHNTAECLSNLGAASQSNKTLPGGTISVSCIGTVGIVSILGQTSQTNQQINSIVLSSDVYREFLYFALLDLEETIHNFAATGATMSNLSKGKFESLQIVCPMDHMVNEFHRIVFSMFEQIENCQLRNVTLRQTRNILLPKLISGELDVSELDIDIGEV